MVEKMKQTHVPLSYCNWSWNPADGPGFLDVSRYCLVGAGPDVAMHLQRTINAAYAKMHSNDKNLLFEGDEQHVPNEDSLAMNKLFTKAYKDTAVNGKQMIAAMRTPNHHHYSIYRAVTSDVKEERNAARERLELSFKVAKERGAKTIVLWNGAEKYSMQADLDFRDAGERYIEMLAYAAELAEKYDMYIAVEPKPFEPENLIVQNSGYLNTLLMAGLNSGKLTQKHIARIGVNDELGHIVMGGGEEVQTVAFVDLAGQLYHLHANKQYERGMQDTDHPLENVTSNLVQVVQILRESKTFSNPPEGVTRFVGLDFQFPHEASLRECLNLQYRNGLILRAAEKAYGAIDWNKVRDLRAKGDYTQARAIIQKEADHQDELVAKEMESVAGDRSIVIPTPLESRLGTLFEEAMKKPEVIERVSHMAKIEFSVN